MIENAGDVGREEKRTNGRSEDRIGIVEHFGVPRADVDRPEDRFQSKKGINLD